MLDVNSTNADPISTTTWEVDLFTDYGTALNRILVEGLIAGDFAIQNLTDALPVTVLTAPEAPAGKYILTFAAQDSADVLELTVTKAGFDFIRVKLNTVIVP